MSEGGGKVIEFIEVCVFGMIDGGEFEFWCGVEELNTELAKFCEEYGREIEGIWLEEG